MELFKTLSDVLGDGCTVNLTIAQKDGKMTVSVLPGNNIVKDTAKNNIIPLTVTGNPDELDAGFAALIAKPVAKATGLLSNMADYEKAADEAAAKSKMEADKKATEEKVKKEFAAWMALAETNLKENKFNDALTCAGQAEKIAKDDASKTQVAQFRTKVEEASGVNSMFGAIADKSDGKNIKLNAKPAKAASKTKADEADAEDEADA